MYSDPYPDPSDSNGDRDTDVPRAMHAFWARQLEALAADGSAKVNGQATDVPHKAGRKAEQPGASLQERPRKARDASAAKAVRAKAAARGKVTKAMVLRGTRERTAGGLTAEDITGNMKGKCVSKKCSALKKNSPWIEACAAARKALGVTGFVAFNSGPQGKALYARAFFA